MPLSIPFLPEGLDTDELLRRSFQWAFKTWSAEAVKTFYSSGDRRFPEPVIVDAVPAPVPAPPTPTREAQKGCPACEVDNEVIRARGRIEAFMLDAEAHGGAISPEMPATLYLARRYLANARVGAMTIRESAPAMAESCDRLVGCIDRADQAVPSPAAVTVAGCQEALPAFVAAQSESTQFVVTYERLVKRARHNDRLQALFTEAKAQDWTAAEFYRRFTEELSHGK